MSETVKAAIEVDIDLLPQLVVMSAIWEYPGGGRPFVSNHCCYVADPDALRAEVEAWRTAQAAEGYKLLDILVTYVPGKRPQDIDKMLLEYIEGALYSITRHIPDLGLLERTIQAAEAGSDPTSDSRWFEFDSKIGEWTFNGTLNYVFGRFEDVDDMPGKRIGDMDWNELIHVIATGYHQIDDLRRNLFMIQGIVASIRQELLPAISGNSNRGEG